MTKKKLQQDQIAKSGFTPLIYLCRLMLDLMLSWSYVEGPARRREEGLKDSSLSFPLE